MTNFKHILVPTDFAPASAQAIELAIGLAEQFGAEVTLLHVWELPVYPYMEMIVNTAELTDQVEQAARSCFETATTALQARLPRAKGILKMGLPWQQILDAIPACQADLVVMGTHGRRGLGHLVMGSVAEKVVRLSPVPVLTTHGLASKT